MSSIQLLKTKLITKETMKKYCILLILLVIAFAGTAQKPRLLITTDIGGDPDDQQSLIRLMLYSCDFEIEGIISSASGTPGELKESIIRPDLIKEIIQAYAEVHPNLVKHRPDFPPPGNLMSVIKKGNPLRGWDNVGRGNDTEASEWIIRCADKEDARPLNIGIWGGQTDLAQALWKVKNTRTADQYRDFVAKLRIYDIADQDKIFSRIIEHFPGLFYILNRAAEGQDIRNAVFRGMYLGGDESLTSMEWFREHVLENHGPLGALYPVKTWTAPNPHGLMKEGDTPSWFYFLENGLNVPEKPEYGGWGGRFEQSENGYYTDATDSYGGETNARVSVSRWRDDFQREFAARLDWCVMDAAEANHPPTMTVNGHSGHEALVIRKKPGKKVKLNASGSKDPDGDSLHFRWIVYPEAGNFKDEFNPPADGPRIVFPMPELEENTSIHLILKGTDNGTPGLTGYKRIILMNR